MSDESENELTQNNNEDVKPKQPPEEHILDSAGTGLGWVSETELLSGFEQPSELDDDEMPHKEPHYYEEADPISEEVVAEPESLSEEEPISEEPISEEVVAEPESLSEEEPISEDEVVVEPESLSEEGPIIEEPISEDEVVVEPESLSEEGPISEESISEDEVVAEPESLSEEEPISEDEVVAEPESLSEEEPISEGEVETDPEIISEEDPVITEEVETDPEIISEEDPVITEEVETDPEIISEEDPVILYETDYGQTTQEDGLGVSDTESEKKESKTLILTQDPDVTETKEDKITKHISIGVGILAVIGLLVWYILSRGVTPNASSLFTAWVADEAHYTVQANISGLTADKVIDDQILSTFKHYIPSDYVITADVKESGGIREVQAQYLVDGDDTNLVFINNDQGVYIQNDGLVDTIDNWLDREQTEVLNQTLSNKWVDFNKFRDLVEIPQDDEPLPYLYAQEEQTDTEDVKELTVEEQLVAWLGSIDEENVSVDEDVTTIKVGTQDSLNFVNTLLQNTELSNFISVLEGDIVITPNSIQYKGDFEFVLYGLKFNGKLDTTLTLSGKKVSLGYDSIDVMDTKEFIGYYFGLLTRDTVKFTQEEFNIIREVILAEREHMTANERKELLKELDKDLFTDEQYKELKQLLTEEIEQDSTQASEDEIKEREERFKELQELLERKEKENEELTNAPPVTSVPVTPARPAPSESSESESSETSEPESSAPETSQPESSTPESSTPETSVPETSVPETSVPETSVPETSQPVESTPSNEDETTTPEPAPTPETPAETPASDSAETQNEG